MSLVGAHEPCEHDKCAVTLLAFPMVTFKNNLPVKSMPTIDIY